MSDRSLPYGLLDTVGDLATLFGSGVNKAAANARELASRVPVVGNPIVDAVDYIDSKMNGGRSSEKIFYDNERVLDSALTSNMRDSIHKKWITEKGEAGPAWRDPMSYVGTVVQAAPEFMASVGAAKLLGGSPFAVVAAEGALNASDAARQARNAILDLKEEELKKINYIQELQSYGMTIDEARSHYADTVANNVYSDSVIPSIAVNSVARGVLGPVGTIAGNAIGDLAQVKVGTESKEEMTGVRGIGGFLEGFAGGAITRQSLDRQKKFDDALEKLAPTSTEIGLPSFDTIKPVQTTPVATSALPDVKLSDTMTSAIDAAVSANPGVDANFLRRLTTIESGGNPNARNPKSSAGGAFQFIDSTAAQYGLKNKFDPVESANAAARLTLANKAHLSKALGRDPTPGELYLAHQQGAGGATKLLTNPDALAIDLVGRDAVRLNGGKVGMTAGQFADLWTKRFGATEPSRNPVDRGELRGADPASLVVAPIDRGRGIGLNPQDVEKPIRGRGASEALSIMAAAFSN